jgi:hypothetical protein
MKFDTEFKQSVKTTMPIIINEESISVDTRHSIINSDYADDSSTSTISSIATITTRNSNVTFSQPQLSKPVSSLLCVGIYSIKTRGSRIPKRQQGIHASLQQEL